MLNSSERRPSAEGLDQEFSSLDPQREAAVAYIASQQPEGWRLLPQHYDDGGCTGANLDRPALQQLLADIRAGTIDCVLVYKVDRPWRCAGSRWCVPARSPAMPSWPHSGMSAVPESHKS
jgi:DNA invertase Pin-like site-specific DNA recombinase